MRAKVVSVHIQSVSALNSRRKGIARKLVEWYEVLLLLLRVFGVVVFVIVGVVVVVVVVVVVMCWCCYLYIFKD